MRVARFPQEGSRTSEGAFGSAQRNTSKDCRPRAAGWFFELCRSLASAPLFIKRNPGVDDADLIVDIDHAALVSYVEQFVDGD